MAGGWRALMSRHPVLSGLMASCISIGAVLGACWLTDDWSLAHRLAAGAVAGAGVGLLIAAPRMIG